MKEERERKEWSETDFRYGRTIHLLSLRLKRLGDENLARHNITFSQLKILAFISRNSDQGEIRQKELEDAFDVRRSSVTSILQNMERAGLVARFNCPEDARIKKIILTEKGKKLDESLKNYLDGTERIIESDFTEEEKNNFKRLLLKAVKNLEKLENTEKENRKG